MAKPELTIKFKADSKSLEKALKNLDIGVKQIEKATAKFTGTQKSSTGQMKKAGVAAEKTNRIIKRQTKNLRIQAGAFATLRSNLLLYSFGVGLAQAALISFVEKSSKLEELEKGFKGLVKGIGGSADSLDKLQQATDNTVSSTDLLKEANNAMMLGVVKSDDEMAQLFDTAQRLGQALGVDTKDAINSIVTGMGRQSKLMLDNLGIVIKSEDAYERYAQKIGVSKNELTDAQKKEAFNQEVLRVSNQMVEQLGDEYLSTGAQLQRMASATHDLSVTIGEVLTPVVTILANGMVALSEHFDAQKLKNYGVAVIGVGTAYVVTSGAIRGAALATIKFIKANKAMMLAMIAVTAVAEVLDRHFNLFGFDELEKGLEDVNNTAINTEDIFKETSQALAKLNRETKFHIAVLKLRNAGEEISGSISEKIQILEIKKAAVLEKINKGLGDQTELTTELYNINADLLNLEVDLKDENKSKALKKLNEETRYNISLLKLKNAEDGVSGSIGENLEILAIKKAALEKQINEGLGEQIDIQTELNEVNTEIHNLEMERHQQKIANAVEMATALNNVMGRSAELQMQQSKQAQQEAINATASIRNERIRQKKIDEINKEYAAKQQAINKRIKRAKKTQTVINTATGIMEVWADKQADLFTKIAFTALVAAAGAQQIKTIDAQKYQYGGLVGGRRHSQGGTMIEAEQGEFVMSREATEAVGIENLNRMNAGLGGGGGSSIVINNPILGKDTIEDEIVPQIKEALRRGGSIA